MPQTDHAQRLTRLEVRQETMERDIHAIREDVRTIRDALLSGKGSWKIVVSLLGLVGAIMVSIVTAWVLSIFGPGAGK